MTTQRAANHVHSDRWQCRVGPCSTNCDLIRRPATPQLGFAPGWRAGAVPEPPRAGSLPHSRDPPATAAPLLESSSTARSRAAAHSLRACACVIVPASLVIEPSATSDEEGKLLGNVPSLWSSLPKSLAKGHVMAERLSPKNSWGAGG